MEKPTRHFLAGADLGKGSILRGIKIDGESLFLRAQYWRRTCWRNSSLIYSHECVFEPQPILADVKFFAAMKVDGGCNMSFSPAVPRASRPCSSMAKMAMAREKVPRASCP